MYIPILDKTNKLYILCVQHGIKMEFIRGRVDPMEGCANDWTITFSRKVDSKEILLTVGFSNNGKKPPDYPITYTERKNIYSNYFPVMHEVLRSYINDYNDVTCYQSFEDWADNFGSEYKDSIRAKNIYENMVLSAKKLKSFLGNDFNSFLNAWKEIEGIT